MSEPIQNIQGAVLLCYENERPLQGLIGKLDWKFNGVFSKLLRTGVLSGKEGDTCYVPFKWNEKNFHFYIVGAGENKEPGHREPFSPDQKIKILKSLTAMGLSNMAFEDAKKGGF